jgi:hypothetical protein
MTIDTAAAEPVSVADDEREQIRDLLVRHRQALDVCEALAMALLESVRPDAPPLTADQAHEHRQAAAAAVAMAQSGFAYLEEFWRMPGLDRRRDAPNAPLPGSVAKDRRRRPSKTSTSKARKG